MQLTKTQQYSLGRLQQAITTIEELVAKERKRTSMQRKRQLEQAHETLRIHGPKLGLSLPSLSYLYDVEQYLEHAHLVANQIQPLLGGTANAQPVSVSSEERE